MYHFPGHYDPSHYQRDPGFFGTRAALASTAKADAFQSGQEVRLPRPNDGPVGYGQAPTREQSNRTQSFYAPPPAQSTQAYSSLRATTTGLGGLASSTQRVPLAVEGGFGSSKRLATSGGPQDFGGASAGASFSPQQTQQQQQFSPNRSSYGDKDLWNHPVIPHVGDRSSYSHASTSTAPFASQSARFPTASLSAGNSPNGSFNASQSRGFNASAQQGAPLTGLVDPAFVDGPDEWRYCSRGVAQAKGVELRRNTDPRQKFLIPGYSGFGQSACNQQPKPMQDRQTQKP
jgi:hypothetical protein